MTKKYRCDFDENLKLELIFFINNNRKGNLLKAKEKFRCGIFANFTVSHPYRFTLNLSIAFLLSHALQFHSLLIMVDQ